MDRILRHLPNWSLERRDPISAMPTFTPANEFLTPSATRIDHIEVAATALSAAQASFVVRIPMIVGLAHARFLR
jgi:hypothetical protein